MILISSRGLSFLGYSAGVRVAGPSSLARHPKENLPRSLMKILNKTIPAVLLGALVLSPSATQAAPLSSNGSSNKQVETVEELMNTKGLSGRIATSGHSSADDGAGMTFSVTSSRPSGTSEDLAVPLADGKWAVPTNLPTKPTRQPNAAAVEDEIARAKTFAVPESELIWDASRATPLTNQVIHKKLDKPYAVTCSSFVGMVLQGWDYQSTTFVSDKNTRVGAWVDFGAEGSRPATLGQAHKLAAWFYANGDMWVDNGQGQFQRGDILFFSKQAPEGADTTGTYFANVYHVAIYLGDGKVIHSAGRSTGAGVVEGQLTDYLRSDLTFVARPAWKGASSNSSTDNDASPSADASATQNQDGAGGAATPSGNSRDGNSAGGNDSPSGDSSNGSGSTDGSSSNANGSAGGGDSTDGSNAGDDPASRDAASPSADGGQAAGDQAGTDGQAAGDPSADPAGNGSDPAGEQSQAAPGDPSADARSEAGASAASPSAGASDPSRGTLSNTGASVGMLLAVMVLLLAGGIGALIVVRRRNSAEG
ncbi:MAG: hypothetical protein Q3979_07460 [Actinomycetaceae bacterium]|nr:hypothetical protein [Actinomycetaceae bacterium]